jgi:hypothetical protein
MYSMTVLELIKYDVFGPYGCLSVSSSYAMIKFIYFQIQGNT